MTGKTILLLGGSMQQVPAITKAKEMGLRTVLIDFLPNNPGQHVADKWYQESTTDIEAVERIAREEHVDGILAYASDPAALPAAIVCERLGLPTNPVKSVEILGIKHLFRKFLQENGFPCPRNFFFSPSSQIDEIKEKLNSLSFPIVIKPTDSSGSKGVTFLSNTNDLVKAIAHADEYSRNKVLIAEEFIERGYPYVIGGDIFVENGKIILYGDMECLRGQGGHSLIPLGEKKPNGLNILQRSRVYAELQKLVDVLNIRFGELNLEILIDKDDNPYFIELGPRAGGNMIPVQLSDAFGVNLLEANILAAIGQSTQLYPQDSHECFMTYVLHSYKNGKFNGVNYSEAIRPHIYREVIYQNKGEQVEIFDGAGKALGIVFMRFIDINTMEEFEKHINEHVVVEIVDI